MACIVRQQDVLAITKITVVAVITIFVMQGDVQIESGCSSITEPDRPPRFVEKRLLAEAALLTV